MLGAVKVAFEERLDELRAGLGGEVSVLVEEVSHSNQAQLAVLEVRVAPQGNAESGVLDVLVIDASKIRVK